MSEPANFYTEVCAWNYLNAESFESVRLDFLPEKCPCSSSQIGDFVIRFGGQKGHQRYRGVCPVVKKAIFENHESNQ
jgi:hypothetical protein